MGRAVSLLMLLAAPGLEPPALSAEEPRVVNVWPQLPPGEKPPTKEERFLDQKPGEKPVKRLTDVSRPTLTIHRPSKEKDSGVSVLICPGGGYHILAWDLEGEEVAAWLNSIGVTGIVLKYRVPRRPGEAADKPPRGPLQDVQRAMSLIRHNAEEWRLDPKRIGVLGFSAGGHLAAAVSTNFERRAYEPVDKVDQVSCRPDFAVLIYPGYIVGRDSDELAADLRVTKDCPPMFLAHAGDDRVRPENSIMLYLALKKAAVPAELHVYAAGGHGFGLRPSEHPCSAWPSRCAEWLRSQGVLKAEAAKAVGQNPSPMVEHTRAHPRLKEEQLPGRRRKLSLGTLFVADEAAKRDPPSLLFHFHGGTWLPETAAALNRVAVISIQLGGGSAAYARPFADRALFSRLIAEAELESGLKFGAIGLSAWSAGYGAVREILTDEKSYQRVSWVLLLDGLHAGYRGGRPGPAESALVESDLDVFVRFAKDAADQKKKLLITHSEVFPGTFASTTETSDYLLRRIGLKRQALLHWGPMQTQQLSEVRRGRLRVAGFAGNSAPDHADHLHALPEFLKWLDQM